MVIKMATHLTRVLAAKLAHWIERSVRQSIDGVLMAEVVRTLGVLPELLVVAQICCFLGKAFA